MRFRSTDGTTIGAWRSGTGPPLVLVHGTTSDHARWNVVLPRLESRFTCFAVDRRGRGTSGDAASYDVAREFEDIAAVVDGIGGPVDLLGHSYGGLCAMETALRTKNLRRLILYEPAAFVPGSSVYGQEIMERLEWLQATGDREGLIVTMLREVAGIPEATIDVLRRQGYWATRVAVAHTILRELRADERYRLDGARLGRITVPTSLFLGGNSPAFYQEATRMLNEMIPTSRVHVLPGQDHAAMDTAPKLFTDAVLAFLTEPVTS